jgi:peptidase M28-like protein
MAPNSKIAAVAFAIIAIAAPTPGAAATTAKESRWWKHVEYLASDNLRGRAAGTPGHHRAAEYVAAEFHRLGLEPGGDHGYVQTVRLVSRTIDEASSALTLSGDGGKRPVALGTEAFYQMGAKPPESLAADLVFVGYGLKADEVGYNDLRGMDLRGKVAVFIQGGPAELREPLRSHAQSNWVRWAALREVGAIGWISIPNPRHLDAPWERIAVQRLLPSMVLADSTLDDRRGQRVAILWNPSSAEPLFEGTGTRFADLMALADSARPLPTFPLKVKVQARVRYRTQEIESENVVAVLPGRDPALRAQSIVLSAHLDHLGVGTPVAGDSIMNGALDNAAGVASLLEVARLAKEGAWHGRRSLVFLACTAEEKGLLGSRFFAAKPTRAAGALAGDLNVDMLLPIVPLKRLIVFGSDESNLSAVVADAARRAGVELQADPEPLKNRFIRSDQYSFIRAGVPSVAFKCGYLAGSAQESVMTAWLRARYHAPSDDLDQPVDLAAADGFSRLFYDAAREAADRSEAPRWNDSSFFRRFSTSVGP